MAKSFKALDAQHQAVLIAMLDAGRGIVRPDELARTVRRHDEALLNIDDLLDDLSSHFIRSAAD